MNICLYTGDKHLRRELTDAGKRLMLGIRPHTFILGDDPGPHLTWAAHARRVAVPLTVVGIGTRPRNATSMRHYQRVIGATRLFERDLYMFGLADAIYIFGESAASVRAWQYAQSLGVRVWLNYAETSPARLRTTYRLETVGEHRYAFVVMP